MASKWCQAAKWSSCWIPTASKASPTWASTHIFRLLVLLLVIKTRLRGRWRLPAKKASCIMLRVITILWICQTLRRSFGPEGTFRSIGMERMGSKTGMAYRMCPRLQRPRFPKGGTFCRLRCASYLSSPIALSFSHFWSVCTSHTEISRSPAMALTRWPLNSVSTR